MRRRRAAGAGLPEPAGAQYNERCKVTQSLGTYRVGPNDTRQNGIYQGDSRELGKSVPDNSVDLIVCDPVYNEVWQYGWLASFAGRALKDGGSVLAQTGHIYRFEAEIAMQDKRLNKRPLIAEFFTGGFTSVWKHHSLNTWHPFIWLEKGDGYKDGRRGWIQNGFFGTRDKSHHRWGDGERAYEVLIDRFTQPGDVVVDPFVGGGTVPAVCKQLGRHFVGFEIDPDTAAKARDRLALTQPPLFVPEAEQLEFATWPVIVDGSRPLP